MDVQTTICAVATPNGEGGIGIIKISGPDTFNICNQIFTKEKNRFANNCLKKIWISSKKGKNLIHGYIIDPSDSFVVDEVLLALMRRPHSYTREDVIEIQSHAGFLILRKILEILLKLGAVIAEPGEFTKRAFLNGRIDLAQAEATADLIKAKNLKALKMANNAIAGKFSKKINIVRNALINIITEIQAVLEFPEDVSEYPDNTKWKKIIEKLLKKQLKPLIKNYQASKVDRNGFKVGIIGRPNVGKSSLLNSLLKKERAIVTELPGTTRDVIEDRITLEDIELFLYDTAGIRESEDIIEKIGVQKTLEIKNNCDLIIFMVDVFDPFNSEDLIIINKIKETPIIYVVNKIDLITKDSLKIIQSKIIQAPCIYISALSHKGIQKVENKIVELIRNKFDTSNSDYIVPNLRQFFLLEKSYKSLEAAVNEFDNNQPEDIIVIGLEDTVKKLGNVIGIDIEPDIIDKIFNRFCIGK